MSEREMSDLIALLERRLGKSWTEIVAWLETQNGLEEITRALSTHDLGEVLDSVRVAAERFAADMHDGFVEAGQRTATWLDAQLPDTLVRFDVANPRAVQWAAQNQLELVRGLQDEARSMMQSRIVAGVRAGENPLVIARDIRTSLGLTPSQAAAVQSYRDALENGDLGNALARELGDGRYDASLRAALRDERSLPQEQIDRMVGRYRDNYIAYRAEVVARTESLRATHQGNEEALRQAIARGDIDASQLVREWHHTNAGKHPRPEHQAMNQQTRRFGEPFETPSGVKLRFPCDPAAPPEQTIQCRCAVSTVLA